MQLGPSHVFRAFVLFLFGSFTATGYAQSSHCFVGQKIDIGPVVYHPGTVMEVSPHPSMMQPGNCKVHYEDGFSPDLWKNDSDLRPRSMAAVAHAQAPHCVVGQKVDVGLGPYHPATVLEVSPHPSLNQPGDCRIHYDDGYAADQWEYARNIAPGGTQQALDAAARLGPRNGKYLILGYPGATAQYNGYFDLHRGTYEVFNPGGRSVGKGSYTFDSASTTMRWQSGPFADKAWSGTQKFEVSREGKTHHIQLMPRTIGTNSTDSSN
jgi:hypothetical protein